MWCLRLAFNHFLLFKSILMGLDRSVGLVHSDAHVSSAVIQIDSYTIQLRRWCKLPLSSSVQCALLEGRLAPACMYIFVRQMWSVLTWRLNLPKQVTQNINYQSTFPAYPQFSDKRSQNYQKQKGVKTSAMRHLQKFQWLKINLKATLKPSWRSERTCLPPQQFHEKKEAFSWLAKIYPFFFQSVDTIGL